MGVGSKNKPTGLHSVGFACVLQVPAPFGVVILVHLQCYCYCEKSLGPAPFGVVILVQLQCYCEKSLGPAPFGVVILVQFTELLLL